jgi:hypothetical protein
MDNLRENGNLGSQDDLILIFGVLTPLSTIFQLYRL